jgi:tripartite-type tricarboxylate transporter receptor subunit TctC
MPGAEGITALNYFVEQVKPDGLTLTMGSSVQIDPLSVRVPQVHYDPAKLHYLGGVGRGGSMMIIDNEASKRIHDPKAEPVVVGSIGGVPRSTMQMAAWGIEYLGWNAKWVVGYRGTSDVMIALERGEVNVTSTGNMFQLAKLLQTGKFQILAQTGTLQDGKEVPRPEFADAPLFPELMKGKIKDPIVQKAFDYWQSLVATDKWLALPPNTPAAMVDTYNEAFGRLMKDPEFAALGKKISEDFEPMSRKDVELLVQTLSSTPDEALGYMKALLRKQGLNVN